MEHNATRIKPLAIHIINSGAEILLYHKMPPLRCLPVLRPPFLMSFGKASNAQRGHNSLTLEVVVGTVLWHACMRGLRLRVRWLTGLRVIHTCACALLEFCHNLFKAGCEVLAWRPAYDGWAKDLN